MISTLSSNWNYPTSVRFGLGRITELADACKSVGIKNPLLITDPNLAILPMVTNAIARNDAEGLPTGLFFNIKPNPVSRNVDDGVKAYLAGGHDGVIAWGGGSGIDAAKAVALMAGQSRPIWDFEDVGDNWLRANTARIAPIVAVPTTSGTGSEVGRASVIANEETQTKKVIFHPTMLPKIVICDPELLVGLPANLTAYTGMDALVHCFEAYCAPGYHPMAEGIALEGMRLVHDWLPAAFEDGSNIEARAQMMSAAAMGATAFQKGLGAIHSLSHPVGSVYDTHHGLTNAVFMPYVMNFNQSAIIDRMDLLARYLSLPGTGYSAVMDWVLELRHTFNIANTPHELGVEESRLNELSQMAANDPTASGNPIPVGAADMKMMYECAMAGKL
jgi:alcohol dehydrogenase class IV